MYGNSGAYVFIEIFFQVMLTILPDPLNQEPLLVENIPDPLAGEQVKNLTTCIFADIFFLILASPIRIKC